MTDARPARYRKKGHTMNILYVTSSSRGSASYSNRVATDVLDRTAHPQSRRNGHGARPRGANRCRISTTISSRRRAAPAGPQTDEQRALLAQLRRAGGRAARRRRDRDRGADDQLHHSVEPEEPGSTTWRARAAPSATREKGPEGLVTGKQVILVAARGGVYAARAPRSTSRCRISRACSASSA